MAYLRCVPFGQHVSPKHFIDLGYARGRLSDGKGSLGGPIDGAPWTAPRQRSREELEQRAAARLRISRETQRCGELMRFAGVACGRRLGHALEHKTPEAVERDNARRRARHAP
jgi:hypothetical protein